ncbi:hypothetical protein AB0E62_00355 [Streptomyces sp. NPDC038707]|uniref:hypothetical protein n=1 Tax=Streptomyces sp. NPDC038707 TaxID=3154329 RepID=UPI0033FE5D8D
MAYCGIGGGDATAQKQWDQDLELYRQARAQGIQPEGTTRNKVVDALKASDAAGLAFGKDFKAAAPMPVEAEAV